MAGHNVSLGFIVFPKVSAVLEIYISEHVLSQRLYQSFNSLLSFPASGPSGLTPIGMLFGCLFCFISWVAFRQAVRRCYLLLMREAYGWDVGMLADGGFSGASAGSS